MKRTFFTVLILTVVLSLVFSSCFNSDVTPEESTTEPTTEATTALPETLPPETSTAYTQPATEAPTETAALQNTSTYTPVASESYTDTPEEEDTQPDGTKISLKGYTVETKNGVTYVDGILVANKTYSLPKSYNPNGLLSSCSAAFDSMKADAAAVGLNIYISSGFRSYNQQSSIYARYCQRDGRDAADRYSARPGHSEHQTGLAIDLNTIAYSFADTPEGQWVAENCCKYGFIIRYPEGKEEQTGYKYEPWHIRYVGVSAATEIYNSGLCFEEYYGITSSYT